MRDNNSKNAVTLLELLVVVLIMGILATVSVAVYTGHVERARVAACRDTIRQLELAINQYEVDNGQLPPSSSGLTYSPNSLIYEGNSSQGSFGCGYMQLALMHSLSGNLHSPLNTRWLGPYIEPDDDQLGDRDGYAIDASTPKGYVQILDVWGSPFYYITSDDYSTLGGTEYPSDHAFYATETYYNPTSFQIFSLGRNGSTSAVPSRGEETDDVCNWRKYGRRLGASGSRKRKIRTVTTSSRSDRSSSAPSNSSRRASNYLPVNMTFNLTDSSQLLFRWPDGWKKTNSKVFKPDDEMAPTWLFSTSNMYDFKQLASRYKQYDDAEIIYEGKDPSDSIKGSFVLQIRSESTPEIAIREEAEGKPYHLLFAFKEGKNTCWWAANFTSWETMEDGRKFITGIVKNKTPLTSKRAR
jgi:prepilin-type N-terminal cleavage/methylation domain-containing protein